MKKSKILFVVMLSVVILTFLIVAIMAISSNKLVTIMNTIVNNDVYLEENDLNGDNKVDVLDAILAVKQGESADEEIEEVQYRYRDIEYCSSTTQLSDPWVLYDTVTDYTHSSYKYVYISRYSVDGTGISNGYSSSEADNWKFSNSNTYCFHGSKIEVIEYVRKSGYSSATGPEYIYVNSNGRVIDGGKLTGTNVDYSIYSIWSKKWGFQICTNKTANTEYFYYKISDWSEWSTTPVTETETREVEIRGNYVVKYDANGGMNAPEKQKKILGSDVTISSVLPTREGHTFEGWSTSANGNVEYNAGDVYSIDASVTLYAVWETNIYTITYDANGGIGAPEPQTKTYGVNIALSSTLPVREGYTFAGWSKIIDGDIEYSSGDNYSNNESISLYAVWKLNIYTISFDANGGTGAPESQSKIYDVEITLSSTVPTRDGYTFTGWSTTIDGDIGYSSGDKYSNNESIVLYAIWTQAIPEGLKFKPNSTGTEYSITDYTGTATDLVLPSVYNGKPVTKIGEKAFFDCLQLKRVVIPNSIISIEEGAFGYCESLINVVIPNGVTSIDKTAFTYCTSLTSITIPDSVTFIGGSAFNKCLSLENIILSNNLTTLETYTFDYCESLTNIIIPNGVTSIGGGCFYECTSLKSIIIPESVLSIEASAFSGCKSLIDVDINRVSYIGYGTFSNCTSLVNVDINYAVSIGDYAFEWCESLANIVIPNSVQSIGNSAFFGCKSLTTVTIPDNVTVIGNKVFSNCTRLKGIYVGDNNPNYLSIDGVLLSKDKSMLISYPKNKPEDSYVIPDEVTIISDGAFWACNFSGELTLPNGIKHIGSHAFYNCRFSGELTLPNGVTYIGNYTFYDCGFSGELIIPKSVTYIGRYAFYECEFSSVVFKGSTTWYYYSDESSTTSIYSEDVSSEYKYVLARYLTSTYSRYCWRPA